MRNHRIQRNQNTFQVLKVKNCQPRILDPMKIFFRNDAEVKMFSDEGKLRESVTNRPTLKG